MAAEAAAFVAAVVARTVASVVSAVASTPLVAACAALAPVSSWIIPTTVRIPVYSPINPSMIPVTTCHALPLPCSALVIPSMLLPIFLIPSQPCCKAFPVLIETFSVSTPASLIASALSFHAAICWLISAASSIVAVCSWSLSISILSLISFRLLASSFHSGVLSTAAPAFRMASALAFHAAICWLIAAASSAVAFCSFSLRIWILSLISRSVSASSFHSGVLSSAALPAFRMASAFCSHNSICWLISTASSADAVCSFSLRIWTLSEIAFKLLASSFHFGLAVPVTFPALAVGA